MADLKPNPDRPLLDNAIGQLEKEITKMNETVSSIKGKLKGIYVFNDPDEKKTPEPPKPPLNPHLPPPPVPPAPPVTTMSRIKDNIEKLTKQNADLNVVLDWLNDLV